jgi:hypothetical protein
LEDKKSNYVFLDGELPGKFIIINRVQIHAVMGILKG